MDKKGTKETHSVKPLVFCAVHLSRKATLVSGNSLTLRLYIMYNAYNVKCIQYRVCTRYTRDSVYKVQCTQCTVYIIYSVYNVQCITCIMKLFQFFM